MTPGKPRQNCEKEWYGRLTPNSSVAQPFRFVTLLLAVGSVDRQPRLRSRIVSPGSGITLLQRLRQETQVIHARVEARVALPDRVGSAAGYRALLEAFYGLYSPCESAVEAFAPQLVPWLPDVLLRLRKSALERDLQVLGNISPQTLPLASVSPLQTVAQAFGCLYVLEGSTLGGQVISRHIGATLGFSPGNGCSFFSGDGADTGRMWTLFRKAVEGYSAAHPNDDDEIVLSAIHTFETFDRWIAGRMPEGNR
jgi:heme oxygenase